MGFHQNSALGGANRPHMPIGAAKREDGANGGEIMRTAVQASIATSLHCARTVGDGAQTQSEFTSINVWGFPRGFPPTWS